MSGFAAWDAIARRPDFFAAAVPIAGGGGPGMAPRWKNLPIWAVASAGDQTCPVSGTRVVVPATLTTLLVPFEDEADIPTAECLPSNDDTALLQVTFGNNRTDWIAVAPDCRELKVGPHSGTGMALCVRVDTDGKMTSVEVFTEAPLLKTKE